MTTVKQLRELLETFPDDYEIVIYPKYSSDDVDGFKKHTFVIDNVCKQEPYAITIKNDPERLKEYFGHSGPYKSYELNKHIAILF